VGEVESVAEVFKKNMKGERKGKDVKLGKEQGSGGREKEEKKEKVGQGK